jgi:hypothetical protein
VSFPALPGGGTYSQDIDNGIATYDATGELHLIQWTTWLASLQWYLPVLDGKVWLSAMYSRSWSPSTTSWGTGKSRKSLDYVSGALFADPLPAVRIGLEYAYSLDTYVDDVTATNHRVNLAVYYLF